MSTIVKWVTKNWSSEIDRVEVLSETNKFVWLKSEFIANMKRRESKSTRYKSFHDSWEAARNHLLATYEQDLVIAERALDNAKKLLEQTRALTKPADE